MPNRPPNTGVGASLWHLSRSSGPHKCRFHLGFSLGGPSEMAVVVTQCQRRHNSPVPRLGGLLNLNSIETIGVTEADASLSQNAIQDVADHQSGCS